MAHYLSQLEYPARYIIWGCISFNQWCEIITWSFFQSVHDPISDDIHSFIIHMYYGIPNSYLESF